MTHTDPIHGGTPIEQILAATELSIHPDRFVLVGLSPQERRRIEASLAAWADSPLQYIVEPDVLTLLLPEQTWARTATQFPDARVEGPLRLFSFSVAMEWSVVGFLAAVTGLLAANGIPLGAVCGYYRDHLFIAEEFAAGAEAILRIELARYQQ
ncbi:MAG: hypothetical protein FOGNACKC_01888 [Anaerolineae bacterium]|nr:hypothetical protein [Anaerolineae bacterium]